MIKLRLILARGWWVPLLSGIWLGLQPAAYGQLRLEARSEPGWQRWQPIAETATADFIAGVTNADSGAQYDFEQACEQSIEPGTAVSYRFRLSTLVKAIGVGHVEYGCWADDTLLRTRMDVAFQASTFPVTCLRVKTDAGGGLNIRSGPGLEHPSLATAANGDTVQLRMTGSPTIFSTDESGRQWLAVEGPRSGYVSVSSAPGEYVNLAQCDS